MRRRRSFWGVWGLAPNSKFLTAPLGASFFGYAAPSEAGYPQIFYVSALCVFLSLCFLCYFM